MITSQNISAIQKEIDRHIEEARDLAQKRDRAHICGKDTAGYEHQIKEELERAAQALFDGSKGANAPLYLGGRDSSPHESFLDQ